MAATGPKILERVEAAVRREVGDHPYRNYTGDLEIGTNAIPIIFEANYAEVHMLMSSDHFGRAPADYASIVVGNNRSLFPQHAQEADAELLAWFNRPFK